MSELKWQSSEKNWRELAAAAARETDSEKLARIIEQLCDALDERTHAHMGASDKKSA